MNHDFESWRAAINATPDDATLLLVFADWLDENGFADAAGWRELGERRVKLWHAAGDDSWTIWRAGRMPGVPKESHIESEWFDAVKPVKVVFPCAYFGWHTGRDSKATGAFTLLAALAKAWCRRKFLSPNGLHAGAPAS